MHSAAVSVETVRQLEFELLAHPHIVQTWLHWVIMFGPLKKRCMDDFIVMIVMVTVLTWL
jgi:hypothetical protein